ncbi:MAG: class I SAM-dependent methyltransferase [Clostridiales bacterium]|nr:class I SAM-dependent methyltransferase [Clostridiales bacterium]
MDNMNFLENYYHTHDEENRLLSRHGMVEYMTTMRYIDKYLFPGARILEIGAGTGRYSLALAKQGYSVDAVELIQRNIDIFKSKITPELKVSIRQGNASDLSFMDDELYDITLLFGPMYHLYAKDDKLKALSEALRVTKKGGLLFTAYCLSDASIIGYGFLKGNIHTLIEKGLLDTETYKTHSTPAEVFELVRKEDIEELMSHFQVSRLHYVATDLFTNYMRDTVDAMDDKTFDTYLKYHFAICERPDMVGISHHSLDIVRKN